MFLVFFFQAEDGIRDTSVTGVQTCALPISSADNRHPRLARHRGELAGGRLIRLPPIRPGLKIRSEERRVGKECRSRTTRRNKKPHQMNDKLAHPNSANAAESTTAGNTETST